MDEPEYRHVMNHTKWEEIRRAMLDFPKQNMWRTKDVETGYMSDWDGDWFYHFKINGDKTSFKTIEWLEIKCENEEIKKELVNVLQEIHVPGEILSGSIKIYGHVKTGTYIDYI